MENEFRLRKAFPLENLQRFELSLNTNAVDLLSKNQDIIRWAGLSHNLAAKNLLLTQPDRIYYTRLSISGPLSILKELYEHECITDMMVNLWYYICGNPNHVDLIYDCPKEYINWDSISKNPNAIPLIEQNFDKINWEYLSLNPNAIHILERNIDKIDWRRLSKNTSAMCILENNIDKIDWEFLSKNPAAIDLLEEFEEKIDWDYLCHNTSAIHMIENNLDKLKYPSNLCGNGAAIELIEKHGELPRDYALLSKNPSIFRLM